MNKIYKNIDIKTINKSFNGEGTGSLSFFESINDIPFDIKRIYYISGVKKGCVRGFHAHKNLKQFIFCPFGKVEIFLEDSSGKTTVCLNNPRTGILIDHPVWREMRWLVDDSLLFVAASDYYSEDDYIRNYEEFLNYVKEGK